MLSASSPYYKVSGVAHPPSSPLPPPPSPIPVQSLPLFLRPACMADIDGAPAVVGTSGARRRNPANYLWPADMSDAILDDDKEAPTTRRRGGGRRGGGRSLGVNLTGTSYRSRWSAPPHKALHLEAEYISTLFPKW